MDFGVAGSSLLAYLPQVRAAGSWTWFLPLPRPRSGSTTCSCRAFAGR